MGRYRQNIALERHRRRKAARRRLESDKFIPTGDSDFALRAKKFAEYIEADPDRYFVGKDDVTIITRAVSTYRDALAKATNPRMRRTDLIVEKDRARKEAERIVRSYANQIRACPDIWKSHKELIGIVERPRKLTRRTCPKQPPELVFDGSPPGGPHRHTWTQGGAVGRHILRFTDDLEAGRRAKPTGAARLELFFDLVPPGQGGVPQSPYERGWPKYLRSYTKNPMEVEFPMPIGGVGGVGGAMLVVFWARWADATGEVSRFSKTCIARVEGWTANALPAGTEAREVETKYVFVQAPFALPDQIDVLDHADARRMLPCDQA